MSLFDPHLMKIYAFSSRVLTSKSWYNMTFKIGSTLNGLAQLLYLSMSTLLLAEGNTSRQCYSALRLKIAKVMYEETCPPSPISLCSARLGSDYNGTSCRACGHELEISQIRGALSSIKMRTSVLLFRRG